MSTYKQQNQNYQIEEERIKKAMDSLPDDEREKIVASVLSLEEAVRFRKGETGGYAKAMFGRKSSLELIAKLGMFLVALEQSDGDYSSLNLTRRHVMDRLLDSVG